MLTYAQWGAMDGMCSLLVRHVRNKRPGSAHGVTAVEIHEYDDPDGFGGRKPHNIRTTLIQLAEMKMVAMRREGLEEPRFRPTTKGLIEMGLRGGS